MKSGTSAGTNMDNHVGHTKITLQSTSGSVYNYYPTKSHENIYRSKSSDKQSFNSHSTYTGHTKRTENATSYEIENKKEVIRILSTEKHHNKQIRELQTRNTLPAKTVFLKWWLDTLGYSKPLRTAWEDEEESMFRSSTSSQTHSPTYFDGHSVSYQQSANSGGYMYVSKHDSHAHNSVSGVSGPTNSFLKTHKHQKTKIKSLRPRLNSSLSLNESVNQKVSPSRQFLDKEDKLYEKKCVESGQSQVSESEHKVNDTRTWLSNMSCSTSHMHDQNTSSNVVLHAYVPSPKTSGASHLINVGIVNKVQKDSLKNNTPLTSVQEVSNQQTSKPDIIKAHDPKYNQNSENNSYLLVNKSIDSQSNNTLLPFIVNGRDIMGSVTLQVNEPGSVELSTTANQNSTQPYVKPNNHKHISDVAVSNGWPQKNTDEKPQYNILLNKETEGAITTTYCDQNYNSPIIRTEANSHNAGQVSLSLAKEACKSPLKSSEGMDEMKEGCLPGNNMCKPKSLSPNFYVTFGKFMSTEFEKHRKLLTNQTDVMNNDSVSVHDGNIYMKRRGSYFSRLAEKRIGVKECQINSHENAPQGGQLVSSKNANTEDQSIPMSTMCPSNNQSNEQSQLPLAVDSSLLWNSALNNDHLVIHKDTLSDYPGNKQIQTSSDCRKLLCQYLPQNSKMIPFDKDNASNNDNASHINQAITERGHAKCTSNGVLSECAQNNDCKMNSGKDPHVKSSTNKTTGNQNYAKFESEDDNSSLDDNEHNSLSSYAYSSVQSVSGTSKNDSSDLDDSVSDYLKWSAGSWSNTSLPPQHYLESKVSKIKSAASATNIEDIRQKQIIQTARLLILMLDELPMKDRVWNENFFHENKRRCIESTFKRSHGYYQRPIAKSATFHSHILSLLRKHYTFNKIKPSLKTENEESVPQQTLSKNETTNNSRIALYTHTNLLPKHKSVCANKKLDTKRTHTTHSFMDNLEKTQFQGATCELTNYESRMGDQGCIKLKKKQKKNVGQLHQMFTEGKSTYGSEKASYEIYPSSSLSNMPFQSVDLENQPDAHKSELNKMSNKRPEKHERNTYQRDVNNSENITGSYIKYGTMRVSKRLNREQSRGLSYVDSLQAKHDHRKENTAAGMETGILMCHKPHPPEALLKNSQVKITLLSPPCFNIKVPVYPKPKPHALGGIQDREAQASKQVCDLPSSAATQLSVSSLKTQLYSGKLPWTKPHGKKKLQASEIQDINAPAALRIATVKNTETQLLLKNNKEACNSKTQKNVLPPLYCITSENIDINSDKLSMKTSKILKSGMLLHQHKNGASQQDCCYTKQDLSSLVHLDSIPKPNCDPKCVSPEISGKIYRKIPLTSLQNHGLLLSPLRQRFDRVKSKVNNGVLKALHSPNLKISCAPHYLYANDAIDNNDMERNSIDSPEVSVSNIDANYLQSLFMQNESDEGNSCNSFEMNNFNLFLNNKNFKSEKHGKISKVSSQHEISAICDGIVGRAQNIQENNFPCCDNSQNARVCDESKVISSQAHDIKTSDITQENNNSDTRCKNITKLVPKAKCPCTSTFKFLTLLLSDELENSQV